MNSNKYALALCVSLFSISAGAADDSSKADHPEIQGALAAVDAWLDGERAYGRVPGISAGVVLDQDLIWSQGYGYSNLADKVPANEKTIYSICSISKLFTSIGMMQLRDEGKLSLSDTVADHLEWYNLAQAHDGGAVDIEGILTHSSGLPREASDYYWNEPDFDFPTRQDMIDGLKDLETLYPARTLFQYSNLGLSLAGEIVAARSGQDYEQYVDDNILTPLGLEDTRSHFPADLHGKQLAIGYTGLDRSGERVVVPPFFTRGVTPAAGFTSTVNDLAKFASWQFRLLENGGTEVLDSNTLREMHRVHWVSPDWKSTWGIGFAVRQAEGCNYSVIGHGGGCPGYITQFIMVPKYKLSVIVLTNAGDGPSGRLASSIMKILVKSLAQAGAPVTDPAIDLGRYEGNYSSQPWGGESAIRQWGNQLAVINLPSTDLSGSVTKLKHVSDDTFIRLTDEGEEREPWHFTLGADGKAAMIHRHGFKATRIK